MSVDKLRINEKDKVVRCSFRVLYMAQEVQ